MPEQLLGGRVSHGHAGTRKSRRKGVPQGVHVDLLALGAEAVDLRWFEQPVRVRVTLP
jgi:hypothetical protein